MSSAPPDSEWLKILLEEIARKQDEARLAQDERDRRSAADDIPRDAAGNGERAP